MKRPTISEVAELAEVSKATVSKVFNNNESISKKTRDKVLKIAKKLDYQPSVIARSLRNKKSKAIGLMVPNITDLFFPQVVKGVEDVALKNGYVVIFCNFDEQVQKESLYFRLLDNRWIDGIIFSGVTGDKEEKKYIQNIEKRGIPIVFIDRGIEGYFSNLVTIDNEDATFKAIKYLLELGHKRIGFINGPREVKIFTKRLAGYKGALKESGLEFDQNLVVEGKQDAETAGSAIKKFLSQKKRPTAISVTSDLVAIALLREVQKIGLRVPGDISIMGFDNVPLACLTSPSLTTTAQPIYKMGVEATKLLIDQIEKKDTTKRKIVLDTTLVMRESTAKVNSCKK